MRAAFVAAATALLLALASTTGQAQSGPPPPPTLPSGFAVENAAGTDVFFLPVDLAFATDGRLFVAEKEGVVWIVKDGRKLATPFLDLQDEVLESGDRGMTSIALDPDFATNGYVYVFYTVNPGGGEDEDRLDSFARITRYTAGGDRARLGTRRVILDDVPACYFSHANDTMLFAPDGSLIVSTGDAASYQQMDAGGLYDECFGAGGPLQPFENIGAFRSQQLESLAGKILRINPRNGHGYPSNPFYNGNPRATRSKVWAYGLRNPFSFTIRPGTGSEVIADGRPGSLFIGDVGWTMWEELNVATTGGQNFGWPCYEGPFQQPQYQAARPATNGCGTVGGSGVTQAQLYWTDNPDDSFPAGLRGDAIIVGDFYQGTRYPTAYQGALFYADFPNGWMATSRFDADDQFEAQTVFSTNTGTVVSFAYDPTTQWMHYLNIVTGEVLRITYDGPLDNPIPLPWQSRDIGAPAAEGMATYDAFANVLTASGSGALGPYDADAFHFVSRDLDGDFVMEGRLDSLVGGTQYARAGFMARQSTAADAAYLHLTATRQDGVYFEWRQRDGTYGYAYLADDAAPLWLRLTRTGDTYTAATSPDGTTWTERGAQVVPMGRRVQAGFAVTADDPAGSLATATFSNLVVEGDVDADGLPVPWRSAQVGPAQGGEEAIFNGSAFSITGAGDVWGS
ncbi:MAG: PQQ-dependent sugar dehydrogenase, partial [Bacteroidota bacterium]